MQQTCSVNVCVKDNRIYVSYDVEIVLLLFVVLLYKKVNCTVPPNIEIFHLLGNESASS